MSYKSTRSPPGSSVSALRGLAGLEMIQWPWRGRPTLRMAPTKLRFENADVTTPEFEYWLCWPYRPIVWISFHLHFKFELKDILIQEIDLFLCFSKLMHEIKEFCLQTYVFQGWAKPIISLSGRARKEVIFVKFMLPFKQIKIFFKYSCCSICYQTLKVIWATESVQSEAWYQLSEWLLSSVFCYHTLLCTDSIAFVLEWTLIPSLNTNMVFVASDAIPPLLTRTACIHFHVISAAQTTLSTKWVVSLIPLLTKLFVSPTLLPHFLIHIDVLVFFAFRELGFCSTRCRAFGAVIGNHASERSPGSWIITARCPPESCKKVSFGSCKRVFMFLMGK